MIDQTIVQKTYKIAVPSAKQKFNNSIHSKFLKNLLDLFRRVEG